MFAGVLSFEDGLRVVKARADSMAAAATLGEPSGLPTPPPCPLPAPPPAPAPRPPATGLTQATLFYAQLLTPTVVCVPCLLFLLA